jgi:hypothetical protein
VVEKNPPAGAAGGMYYEPRSFWSIGAVDLEQLDLSENAEFARYVFNREEFRNGQRWPITINRVAVCPVNYLYDQTPTGFANARDAAANMLNRLRIRISVPFRQSYSRFEIAVGSHPPAPVYGEPYKPGPLSGLFGQVRLNYDHPLYVPQKGSVELGLSSPADVNLVSPPVPNLFSAGGVTQVPSTIAYLEEGGLFVGNARSHSFPLNLAQNPNGRPNQEQMPYPLPPGFALTTANNGVQFWDGRHRFNSKEFNAQDATRAGSTKQVGVGVAIDQRAYDDRLVSVLGATGKISPLATRVGSRVKCVNFGSQADWWRPGAPLALTFDSITPALVYRLPQPVTLQPGDCFVVEALFPGPNYFSSFGYVATGESEGASKYALGISFNGFAAVEG